MTMDPKSVTFSDVYCPTLSHLLTQTLTQIADVELVKQSYSYLAFRSNLPVVGFLTKMNGKRLDTTIRLALVVGSELFVIIISVSAII